MAYLDFPVYPWVYTEYSQDVKMLECQLAGSRSLVNDIIENRKFTKKIEIRKNCYLVKISLLQKNKDDIILKKQSKK